MNKLENFDINDNLENFDSNDNLENFNSNDNLENFDSNDHLENFDSNDHLENFDNIYELENFYNNDHLENFDSNDQLEIFYTNNKLELEDSDNMYELENFYNNDHLENFDSIDYNLHKINNKPIIIPLIYSIIDNHKYDNIILIHDKINNPDQFALYANSKSLSIIYNSSSSNKELIQLLNKYFTSIKRIAFVFHNSNINTLKKFINNKPFFNFYDLEINTTEYSINTQFIIDLVNKFNVMHLDYLGCNTLLYDHWNKYFSLLKQKTNAIIGASNDFTGNIKYGGDWILENTNEDIKNIYFINNIVNYKYTFAKKSNDTIIFAKDTINSNITCTFSDNSQQKIISTDCNMTIIDSKTAIKNINTLINNLHKKSIYNSSVISKIVIKTLINYGYNNIHAFGIYSKIRGLIRINNIAFNIVWYNTKKK